MMNVTRARAALVYPMVGSEVLGERLVAEAAVHAVGELVVRNVIAAPSTWEAVARINVVIEDLVEELAVFLAGVNADNYNNVQYKLIPVVYERVMKVLA